MLGASATDVVDDNGHSVRGKMVYLLKTRIREMYFDTSVSPSIVYAVTGSCVLKSSDGGSTWDLRNNQ